MRSDNKKAPCFCWSDNVTDGLCPLSPSLIKCERELRDFQNVLLELDLKPFNCMNSSLRGQWDPAMCLRAHSVWDIVCWVVAFISHPADFLHQCKCLYQNQRQRKKWCPRRTSGLSCQLSLFLLVLSSRKSHKGSLLQRATISALTHTSILISTFHWGNIIRH